MRYMQGLKGFVFLLLFQCAGVLLTHLLRLPFPGPVMGMLLLLPCLRIQSVREPVEVCADVLLSHMSLLFIPVSVGILAQLPLLQVYGGRVAAVLVISCVLGLLVTGRLLTWWLPERKTFADSSHEAGKANQPKDSK